MTSLWSAMVHADGVVQCVLMGLLLASLVSWTLIFGKWQLLRRVSRQQRRFVQGFEQSPSLGAALADAANDHSLLAKLMRMGLGYHQAHMSTSQVKTMMAIDAERLLRHLRAHLSVLATIGSVAPYVGLLGTVWGIMTAFRSLSGLQQVSMSMVAPGISEALIATAIGLMTAIPAVIAYNRFSQSVGDLEQDVDLFIERLLVWMDHSAEDVTHAS